MTIHRILCPTDFSETSDHALQQAAALARWYGARLTVLHVRLTVTPHPDMPEGGPVAPWLEADTEALRARTTAACQAIIAAGTAVDVAVLRGEPVQLILDMADSLPADLIVMGTHGTSGFRRLLLGSVTEKVLRRATCPVLTVPPRAQTTVAQPFTSVICGVDFSDCSTKAVKFAASVATQSGAALTLVHVLEWPWHEPPVPTMEGVPPEQARALARVSALPGDQRRLAARGPRRSGAAGRTDARGSGPFRKILRRAAGCRSGSCTPISSSSASGAAARWTSGSSARRRITWCAAPRVPC